MTGPVNRAKPDFEHTMLNVYKIDPLTDGRWAAFLERHPESSVFHTPAWLRSLQRSYGYTPLVYTTSLPGRHLENGIVFCLVQTLLGGSRLVSLPFSDHCAPLVEDPGALSALVSSVGQKLQKEKWKYIELRPPGGLRFELENQMAYEQSDRFYIHTLDLHEDLDAIFGKLHKSCIQRKIHRAERENLGYEEGRSRALLERFYHLVVLTRRRHQLPPQPFRWYRNLSEYMGESLTIRIVSKEGRPVAGLLTLAHGNTLVYKYGGSDAQFHNLGGMPLLFWKTIQSAKASGVVSFDLGRSEPDNEGLVSFKGHLGAVGSEIAYYRYPTKASQTAVRRLGIRAAKYVFARLPDVVRVPAGALLYKHMG